MKNVYLKKFMPITWDGDKKKITITFLAEIYNNQSLVAQPSRIGDGYACCVFKVDEDEETQRTKKHLEKTTHDIVLQADWDKSDQPDHITTLILLHNPAADNDSMETANAPTL